MVDDHRHDDDDDGDAHTPSARSGRGPYYPPVQQPLRAPWDPAQAPDRRQRSIPGSRDRYPRQSRLGRFIQLWGWRAYAIPVLVVLTTLAAVDAIRTPDTAPPDVAAAKEDTQSHPKVFGGPPVIQPSKLSSAGQLPPGGKFAQSGDRIFRTVAGSTEKIGRGDAQAFTYVVEIEEGVDTTDLGGDGAIARMVDATLANPKSWTGDGAVSFQRVSGVEPSFRVSLTTPETIRGGCGYEIKLESSCYSPADSKVYINLARWVRGARTFEGDIGSYRQYVINHEVGHAIGYAAHQPCPKDGALAPIMMQQTFALKNSLIVSLSQSEEIPDNDAACRFNSWPFPNGI